MHIYVCVCTRVFASNLTYIKILFLLLLSFLHSHLGSNILDLRDRRHTATNMRSTNILLSFPQNLSKTPSSSKQLPTSYHSCTCIALDRYPQRIIRTYIYQSLECIEPQSYIYLRNHHFFYLGTTHIRIYSESLTSILRKYIQHLIYAYPQKSLQPNTNIKI